MLGDIFQLFANGRNTERKSDLSKVVQRVFLARNKIPASWFLCPNLRNLPLNRLVLLTEALLVLILTMFLFCDL